MNGLDLMRKLGSGVMPAGIVGTPSTLGRADHGATFETMLRGAFAGREPSGLPVSVSPSAGLTLSKEQLDRMASAVDSVEASGAKSALVELDGAFYSLDVASRRVTGIVDINEATALGSLDTVIRAPASTGGRDSSAAAPVAGRPDTNWLLKRLASAT